MKNLRDTTWWIYAAVALAVLPALLLRDFTPDNELRYLSIADEALENGSLFCFSNHGLAYADKPPLYLWIVMLGKWLLGGHYMWFLGLFSLVPMLLVGKVMDSWVAPAMSLRQRQTALLMLFSCGYFPALGITLRMDMLMTLWIVLALREAYRMATDGPSHRRSAMMGLYTFLALFTKGPLGVIIPLLGSLVFLIATRRGRMFVRIWSWPAWAVLLGGCALWFGAVWAEGGKEYLDNLLFHQTVDRAHNAFHHKRPLWYYAVCVWYVMAPWSLVVAWQCVTRRREMLDGDFRRMMVAVFAVTFVVLSCISSKLQVYLLPSIPFVVYLCASVGFGSKLRRTVGIFAAVLFGLVFAAGCAMPWINPLIGYGAVCKRVAERHPAEVVVDSGVRRGENIDAYFDCPVSVADSKSADFVLPDGAVLLVSDPETSSLTIYECNR